MKPPVLKPRKVERILLSHGFIKDTKHGSHQSYYNPISKCHTTIAFHPGTIPLGTMRAIIKQSGLHQKLFRK